MRRYPPSRYDHLHYVARHLPDVAAATCMDAFGWWIALACTNPACPGHLGHYPVRMLLERYNCETVRLLDVVRRLRCKRCRAEPTTLQLVDDASRGISGMRTRPAGGGELPTVIDLLPLLAPVPRGGAAP